MPTIIKIPSFKSNFVCVLSSQNSSITMLWLKKPNLIECFKDVKPEIRLGVHLTRALEMPRIVSRLHIELDFVIMSTFLREIKSALLK